MDDSRFCGIISSLHLRKVDNVTAHRGSSNKATISKVNQLISKNVRALFFLPSPVSGSSTSSVESAIQIAINNSRVVVKCAINHRTLSPRDAGVRNDDIESTIKFFDNSINCNCDSIGIGDIALEGFGCSQELVEIAKGTDTDL